MARLTLFPFVIGALLAVAPGRVAQPQERCATTERQPSAKGAPALPAGLVPGRPGDLLFPGDRPLRVAHAGPGVRQAVVYLHGMCGNESGADSWADVAIKHGTLITLRADVPCGDRPGFKWTHDANATQARIERALELVRGERGGALDAHQPILVGYSQGAHRAERLAAAFPGRYRQLILGGPPTSASPDRLRHVTRVVILGGELENTEHMMSGYLSLTEAGISADFMLLPRSGHGNFGPEGRRVMGEAFAFVD